VIGSLFFDGPKVTASMGSWEAPGEWAIPQAGSLGMGLSEPL
jgi:hypothetical protein